MPTRLHAFDIRPACPADVPIVLELIRGLAAFEHLTHFLEVTEERIHEALFGARPQAEAIIAWHAGDEGPVGAGFALYFHNYSTFLGRPGLYLEDLFVHPQYRGRGCGRALLASLARIACERGCGRFEWSVLDWNRSAQKFYQSLGAIVLPDWRIVRMTGDAMTQLARLAPHGDAKDETA